MKKILNCILVLVLTLLLIPNVFATNNVSIDSITLKEKSESLLVNSQPTSNGMNIQFDLGFLKVGDYVKYEVVIANDSNKDYYIDNESKFTNSEYISYKYDFDNNIEKIKPNSKLTMYITIQYSKKVPPEKLVNGIYTEENAMRLDLTDVLITNPKTYVNVVFLVLILTILILITIIQVTKKKKIGLNILLIGLLLIPITTYALERITIRAQTKILIEEKRNIIEYRYENGIPATPEKDFWQYSRYIKTITFKNKIEEPSDYSYKFDVSQEKNNSIIAYLVPIAESQYDLYIMSNGYIYANPDSSSVFSSMTSLSKINNIEYFKTTYAETMKEMFRWDVSIEELDLSSWDTSNVTDMSGMFILNTGSDGLGLLRKLNLSNWDTSKVTNMSRMFNNCEELEELDLSSFNTSNVTDMNLLIVKCNKLKNRDLSNFDTSKVTDMSSMLSDNRELISVDLSSFDTSYVTTMQGMFYNNRNLEHIYVGNKWNVENVETSTSMFYKCEKLPNFDPNYKDKTRANTSETGYLTLKS